mgnify:CR=1 FL=1
MQYMRPKFYADEHVPVQISMALRKREIDIITCQQAEMLNQDDEAQLRFALRNGRALITYDSDFLTLVQGLRDHCGLLFFTRRLDVGTAVRIIEEVYFTYSADDLKNTVLFLPSH